MVRFIHIRGRPSPSDRRPWLQHSLATSIKTKPSAYTSTRVEVYHSLVTTLDLLFNLLFRSQRNVHGSPAGLDNGEGLPRHGQTDVEQTRKAKSAVLNFKLEVSKEHITSIKMKDG